MIKTAFDTLKKIYQSAKRFAKNLFNSVDDPEPAIATLVVRYHNLANLSQHKNHLQLAFQELGEV
ncbi:MAG: hypothetical protein ACI854_000814 [Arenicella sp.]